MRYYFHLRESEAYVLDEEGLELPGIDAVLREAIVGARSVMAGEVMQGKLPLRSSIEVDDENGQRVLDLPFGEAVLLDR